MSPNLIQVVIFFQRPKTNASSDIWYVNCPIGKNKLSTMMKELSGKAQLPLVYTNHCLRVISATVLNRNDFNINNIRSVTGHKSVDGVLPYVEGTSDAQRYKMSKSLHRHGEATSTAVSDSPVKTPVSARSSSVVDNVVDPSECCRRCNTYWKQYCFSKWKSCGCCAHPRALTRDRNVKHR